MREPPDFVDYPAEFRERAEEIRSIAELVHDARNREILLKCAADYEAMAAQHDRASVQGGKFRYPPNQSSRNSSL